jgi:hypothetical protein
MAPAGERAHDDRRALFDALAKNPGRRLGQLLAVAQVAQLPDRGNARARDAGAGRTLDRREVQRPAEAQNARAAARVVVQRELGGMACAARRDFERVAQGREAARGADLVGAPEALDRGGALRDIDRGRQGGAGVGVRETRRAQGEHGGEEAGKSRVWCMAVTCGARCRGERESGGGSRRGRRRAGANAACWAASGIARRRRGSGKRWPTPRTGRRAKHAQRLKDRAGKWGRISCGRGQQCRAQRTGIFRRPDNHFGRPRNAAGHRGRVPKFIGGDPEDLTRQTRQTRLETRRGAATSACVHSNEHPIHHPNGHRTGIRSDTRTACEPTPGGAWLRASPRRAHPCIGIEPCAVARACGGGETQAEAVSAHRLTAPGPRRGGLDRPRRGRCARPWSASTA